MNEISCELCQDLIPLVRDGAASEESRETVMQHIALCDACRTVYEDQKVPEGNEGKSLSKAMKRVQKVSVAVLTVILFLCVCLCERVLQGSSMVFLVIVLLIWRLSRTVTEKGKSLTSRGVALITVVALTAVLCVTVNTLVGNPFSRMLAEKAAENYLAGKFPEGGYEVADVWFDSKRGHYGTVVQKSGSQDIRFTVDTDRKGNFHHDTYDNVLTGWNTANRLEDEYRLLAEPVLKRLNLSFDRVHGSGSLEFELRPWQNDPYAYQYFLNGEPLIPDGKYDIYAEGAKNGSLRVNVEDETVSLEKAAEILLELRRLMDEAGVAFHHVDLTLGYPRPEDPMEKRKEGGIQVEGFLYEDIYEEGLAKRIGKRK